MLYIFFDFITNFLLAPRYTDEFEHKMQGAEDEAVEMVINTVKFS
jgi:hypothetical protein